MKFSKKTAFFDFLPPKRMNIKKMSSVQSENLIFVNTKNPRNGK